VIQLTNHIHVQCNLSQDKTFLDWKVPVRQNGMDVPGDTSARPACLSRIACSVSNDIRNWGLGNTVTPHKTTTERATLFLMSIDYITTVITSTDTIQMSSSFQTKSLLLFLILLFSSNSHFNSWYTFTFFKFLW